MNDKKIILKKLGLYKFIFIIAFIVFPIYSVFGEEVDIVNDSTLTDDLFSYWSLDEEVGVREDLNSSYDLQDHNGVEQSVGIIEGGVEADSLDTRYLYSDNNGGASFNTMSWSVWVNPTEDISSGETNTLTSVFDTNTNTSYDISYRNSNGIRQLVFQRALPGVTSHQVYYPIKLDAGVWIHLAMTYDGVNIRGYVNGSLVGTIPSSGSGVSNVSDSISIGVRYWALEKWYADAKIDEVGLWSRALTADEVTKLYNDGKGLPYEVVEPEPEGNSSVAFLHGFPASRLYYLDEGDEEQVWETADTDDLSYLGLTKEGKSINTDIYTRDILDDMRPVTGWWKMADGYEGWIDFMDGLVAGEVIEEWKPIAYDWRLAQDFLVKNGKDIGNDNVSYLVEPGSVPYIIDALETLADTSPTEKVTIVAHSNGGLVVKSLMKHLKETNHDLLNKIDTVVLVASPQAGTPKTVRELLHGTDTVLKGAIRTLVENMPGAYGLLPSRLLMGALDEAVVEVDKSVKNIGPLNDIAGKEIHTYDELRAFLVQEIGVRHKPGPLQTQVPNILNEKLIDDAQNMHDGIDEWVSSEGIRFVQLVGTGLTTARGVQYGTREEGVKENGKPKYVSTVEWLSNTKGDGTVLVASAESGNADETYYFEMDTYNTDKDTNYVHSTILSTTPIQQFIQKNVIEGESSYIPLYMKSSAYGTRPAPRFELRAYSPVDIHLYRDGKHTGVTDEEETELGRYYEEELSNSYYEEWAGVKYIGADFSQGGVLFVLKGTGDGVFTLEMDVREEDPVTETFTFSNIPVTSKTVGTIALSEGVEPVLLYDYDGDGEVDFEIRPEQNVSEKFKKWLQNKVRVISKLTTHTGKGTATAIQSQEKVVAKKSK